MTHPSKDIMFTKSRLLEGKKIALCVCGSVAAIKAPELARELMRNGAEVFAVMSPSSQKLISPSLLEWATGNPVVTELTGKIEHVLLGRKGGVDLVLIAPATANTIGKIAAGIDDTPVTSL
ncbi:MAG: flavoprotein, partial [Candidatus Methanomethylicaceae archaeon]